MKTLPGETGEGAKLWTDKSDRNNSLSTSGPLDQDCPTSLWILRVASAALDEEESAGRMRGLVCGGRVEVEYPVERDQKLDDGTILVS